MDYFIFDQQDSFKMTPTTALKVHYNGSNFTFAEVESGNTFSDWVGAWCGAGNTPCTDAMLVIAAGEPAPGSVFYIGEND